MTPGKGGRLRIWGGNCVHRISAPSHQATNAAGAEYSFKKKYSLKNIGWKIFFEEKKYLKSSDKVTYAAGGEHSLKQIFHLPQLFGKHTNEIHPQNLFIFFTSFPLLISSLDKRCSWSPSSPSSWWSAWPPSSSRSTSSSPRSTTTFGRSSTNIWRCNSRIWWLPNKQILQVQRDPLHADCLCWVSALVRYIHTNWNCLGVIKQNYRTHNASL